MALLARDVQRIEPSAPEPTSDRAADWVASGTPEPLRSGLRAALGGDRVLDRALDLVAYASDASPYRQIPQAVIRPRDVDDVVKLLAFARASRTPLVFRAGGTSLNGQAQTDSILVDCRRHWPRVKVQDGGLTVRVQPGVVLGHVNRLLARHGRKLGPDPASSDIACVGGVIANNSGGMRCGVVADSYRTVRSLTFVLSNGAVIDTSAPDAEERFADAAPELARGLTQIRDELRADGEMAARVARKFEIKNTTGYRLCAFLDADSPLEIFRRLIIGSEGTLAFVSEAVFDTVPFGPHAALALALFKDMESAAEAVGPLVDAGASATELLVAPTLIAAAYNMPGTPEDWKELPPEAAALLVEFRHEEPAELDAAEATGLEILSGRETIEPPAFTRDRHEIEMLWHVREGMHGLLASIRPPGTSLIVEDVCVPPARVAEAARDLQQLLGRHGFMTGVAGHASAGNLHFMLTPNFEDPADLERYEAFIRDLVELVITEYDGSLKAEHGTGVNMSPYVEREWGSKATELMWRVKRLADPDGILAPGVVLGRDEGAHLRNLKSTPEIEESATKCIECGFCEPVCPSRNVTTTPRQRIAVRREMARQPAGSPVTKVLLEQYEYDAIQTCAADGSCRDVCPVGIDAGRLIKDFRRREHSTRSEDMAAAAARGYSVLERVARATVRAGAGVSGAVGDDRVAAVPAALRRAVSTEVVPSWSPSIPAAAPSQLPFTLRDGAVAVYMPACINRIFGNAREEAAHPTLPEALVAISARAGLPLWIPPDVAGNCCGTPWASKGYVRGHDQMAARVRDSLARWSEGGRLPVIVDATSCTYGLLHEVGVDGVEVIDSIAWVHDRLLQRLELSHKLERIVVHRTCASDHLGLSEQFDAVAEHLADEVVIPAASTCCGMAGDRGWLHPELPASALRDVATELDGQQFDACVSSNRTCEAALRQVTGRPYRSFVLALEELTRDRA